MNSATLLLCTPHNSTQSQLNTIEFTVMDTQTLSASSRKAILKSGLDIKPILVV